MGGKSRVHVSKECQTRIKSLIRSQAETPMNDLIDILREDIAVGNSSVDMDGLLKDYYTELAKKLIKELR